MMKKYLVIAIGLILSSCSLEPKEINYGKDECSYCKMTINDSLHASEIISRKGKIYKYDAIECMMRHNEGSHDDVSYFFVNTNNEPGVLINAKNATFLISKNLPSPMGEYLNAFTSKKEAENSFRQNGGDFYTWKELTQLYINKELPDKNQMYDVMKCEPGKCAPGKCG